MLVAQAHQMGSVGVDLVNEVGECSSRSGWSGDGCISEHVDVLQVHSEKLPSTIDAFARGLSFRFGCQSQADGSVFGRKHDVLMLCSPRISGVDG
jgi:hypothetical protein